MGCKAGPAKSNAAVVNGHGEIGGPMAGIFSVVMGLGVLSFAVNLWLKGFPEMAGDRVARVDAAAQPAR